MHANCLNSSRTRSYKLLAGHHPATVAVEAMYLRVTKNDRVGDFKSKKSVSCAYDIHGVGRTESPDCCSGMRSAGEDTRFEVFPLAPSHQHYLALSMCGHPTDMGMGQYSHHLSSELGRWRSHEFEYVSRSFPGAWGKLFISGTLTKASKGLTHIQTYRRLFWVLDTSHSHHD